VREVAALILDFGQVVTRSIFELAAYVERGFGLAPGTFPWRGPLAPEGDPLWIAMLEGQFSERDYWARRLAEFAPLTGLPLDMHLFNHRAYGAAGSAGFRPETASLVDDARAAGYKIGILTNELELFHGREFVERLAILAHVDAVVDASHTQILKPDPRAYALIADALHIFPEEALFVDDQPHNVAGARAAGMNAIHFRIENVPASIAEIRTALQLADTAGSDPDFALSARRESDIG
jgi:putative hydrolase of the HAD superfamily